MKKCEFLMNRVDNRINLPKSFYTYQLSPLDAGLHNVSKYLSQAILLEVCTHPKPGLVTRMTNGAHNDMSIMTFAMSSAVLSRAFYELQDIGMAHIGDVKELFRKVRAYGINVEKELLVATKGVNTQRGILFAGGILSAAAGYAINHSLSKIDLLNIVKMMTEGLVHEELEGLGKTSELTAGEKLYRQYGITGIRGEVENGFLSVQHAGLPALHEAFKREANLNDALVHTLISLMTVVEDSNVLWRTDFETAEEVKIIAKKIIALGSVFTNSGRKAIQDTEKYFVHRRISPGGSADLLSVTIGLYLLENKEFPVNIF